MFRSQSPPFSVFQKVPVNKLPPGSPTGTHMERFARFHSPLLHVSRVSHKCSPDKKKYHPSLEGPRKGASHVPKKGASMKTDAHFQSLT